MDLAEPCAVGFVCFEGERLALPGLQLFGTLFAAGVLCSRLCLLSCVLLACLGGLVLFRCFRWAFSGCLGLCRCGIDSLFSGPPFLCSVDRCAPGHCGMSRCFPHYLLVSVVRGVFPVGWVRPSPRWSLRVFPGPERGVSGC